MNKFCNSVTYINKYYPPSPARVISVASKIWKPRDQHSPGFLPPARRKIAWVRGCGGEISFGVHTIILWSDDPSGAYMSGGFAKRFQVRNNII